MTSYVYHVWSFGQHYSGQHYNEFHRLLGTYLCMRDALAHGRRHLDAYCKMHTGTAQVSLPVAELIVAPNSALPIWSSRVGRGVVVPGKALEIQLTVSITKDELLGSPLHSLAEAAE